MHSTTTDTAGAGAGLGGIGAVPPLELKFNPAIEALSLGFDNYMRKREGRKRSKDRSIERVGTERNNIEREREREREREKGVMQDNM